MPQNNYFQFFGEINGAKLAEVAKSADHNDKQERFRELISKLKEHKAYTDEHVDRDTNTRDSRMAITFSMAELQELTLLYKQLGYARACGEGREIVKCVDSGYFKHLIGYVITSDPNFKSTLSSDEIYRGHKTIIRNLLNTLRDTSRPYTYSLYPGAPKNEMIDLIKQACVNVATQNPMNRQATGEPSHKQITSSV